MEPEIKIGDLSPWHHLIFVKELADHISDKANCKMCREQAVGPVYKCLECDFIQHKSCPNPTKRNWESWMKNHYYEQRHHLMLVEEVENRAEEEVVCRGCQEPPSLPAYRCSNPGCSFLLHKSCAELSSLAVLHPQHSDHVLTLQARDLWSGSRGEDKRCNACKKLIKYLDYGCRRCNVYLHPKCSAPEMELQLEPQPEPRYRSPWHHLIFVEELAYKDECSLCREQAVGPVYKCLELDCRFILHKSCPKPTKRDWEWTMKGHYSMWRKDFSWWDSSLWRHHLMLVEEVENRAEEAVVCWGCEEPPSLPAYKCVLPGCTFLLHKSCTELPLAVLHLQHADHVLTLKLSEEKCNFCLETKESLLYGCDPCDFHLHIHCTSHIKWLPRLPFVADDCHEHAVIPASMRDPFTCQACGNEVKCSAYFCLICRLTMEKSCCDFPHFIKTRLHGRSLIFIHSVRLINKGHRVFCRICLKRVNTRYGAYYCVKCGYILHLKCARRYEYKGSTTESLSDSCEELIIYLFDRLTVVEDKRADEPEIKHFNHPQHDLILSHEEPGYDKKCEACMHVIFFAPFYGCGKCNFFVHARCAKLPTTIERRLFHDHPLALTSQASLLGKYEECRMCYLYREGYKYMCEKCDQFKVDVQCALLPEVLEHHLHQHILFLIGRGETHGMPCKGCDSAPVAYVCVDDCKFGLCHRCVTLPPVARYRYHPHPLTLTFAHDDEDQEDNYCFICEEKRDSRKLFYWCEECDFTIHSNCILGSPFKLGHYVREDHGHPLSLVETTKDSPPCKACGESYDRPIEGHSVETYYVQPHNYVDRTYDVWRQNYVDRTAVECPQCKFLIHKRCQTEMFSKSS